MKYTTFINRFSNPLILYKPDEHTPTDTDTQQQSRFISHCVI